jgi:hypothetical protein
LAIVTYAVDPALLANMISERFTLTTLPIEGNERALVSAVSFLNDNFRLAAYPSPKLKMAQVNYRTYVTNRTNGERCVWFLGTVLDSWTVIVTRCLWMLPWHKGKIELTCDIDLGSGRYRKYKMQTLAEQSAADLELRQDGTERLDLPGFPDLETGLIYLSHPLHGFNRRLDGRLSHYRIWHPRINLRAARLERATYEFLNNTALVSWREQQQPHSVMIAPASDFTIYLPPRTID